MARKTPKKKKGAARAAKPKVKAAGAGQELPTAQVRGSEHHQPSKKDTVIAMIGRKKGATLAEIMEATGWQKHSVRGFMATLNTKGGFNITSEKNAAGDRVYQGSAA